MQILGQETKVYLADFYNNDLKSKIEDSASSFLSSINTSYNRVDKELILPVEYLESFTKSINTIWEYTPFYFEEEKIIESVTRLSNGEFQIRNIIANFVDDAGIISYEEVVLNFSKNGMINDFRISIPAQRYKELLNSGDDEIDVANREQILTFVENFRTAYNKKDIQFIDNVFSDQALIIVGRVVENTGITSEFETQVEYLQFTKTEYVERLKNLFTLNKKISVQFEDLEIIKHPKYPEIYGVTMTQYYSSTLYSDEGYLFLLIDFKDPNEPLIHVRTWQPKQITSEEEVFNIGFMEIF
jgi:hypothetical protein